MRQKKGKEGVIIFKIWIFICKMIICCVNSRIDVYNYYA